MVLDEPTNEFGSVAAAPVFSEIVQSALNQYRVAPTDVGDQRQFDAARAHAAEEGSNCAVLHGAALQEHLARQAAAAAAAAKTAADARAASSTGAASDPTDTLADDTSPSD